MCCSESKSTENDKKKEASAYEMVKVYSATRLHSRGAPHTATQRAVHSTCYMLLQRQAMLLAATRTAIC